ncbi:MAG: type II secretion system F family protein [Vicinamibacterales bacterium]
MVEVGLAVGSVFVLVLLASMSIATYALGHTGAIRRRVMAVSAAAAGPFGGKTLADVPLLSALDPAIQKVSTYIPKSPKEMTRLQHRLATAGYHGARPFIVFCAAQVALAVVGLCGPLIALGPKGVMFGLGGAFIGYSLPGMFIRHGIAARKKQIQNGLPDALDLLIVCVEAGLAIDQAILKAGVELGIAYPALGEELRLVNVETRAGKPRLEAFKNFARRTQVDDVRALVAMLVQTDRFGTSIAQALRTQAEVARTKRRQRAEEKAAKLGVKLIFPLVFCLLPAFFVVALGPAVIQMMNFFSTNSFAIGGGL